MNLEHDKQLNPKPKIKHDGALTIATGRSRKETDWKNREMLWSELVDRLSRTNRTGETFAEYKKLPKKEQGQIKDVGGFVGGTLKGGRRKADAVVWRQVITLDADFAKGDIWASVEMFFDYACAMYSTHAHSPEKPRLRLVIPMVRPITPDEYPAVARWVAADYFNIDMFDDTTYEPHRLMYWPSTSADGDFLFKFQDGPWLDPDTVLARYPDWRDTSYWPESSRVQQARQKLAEKQGDPLTKPGIVGAFCRTYTIQAAIETFLEDVYGPVGDGRYTFLPGSTAGGLVVYDSDTFAYSHHGTDPISGKLVNAFDLIRLHKFGTKDDDAAPGTPTVKLPSYEAMLEFATEDPNVRQTMGEEMLANAQEDFKSGEDWLKRIKRSKQGRCEPTAPNVILILENDPNLAGKIASDIFSHRNVILSDLPWRKVTPGMGAFWGDDDDAGLRNYLARVYEIKGQSIISDALREVLIRHSFHPVREYLESLCWDGLPRLDTVLIDYLGAEDSAYTRAVTRKALVAAVARVMRPGCKFDNMPVLVGPQGAGKSQIVSKLGQQWYSDSLNTVQGKEAYEAVLGAWLIELAELAGIRKAEVEAIKHFISKQEDRFRVSYGKHTSSFPRQCIFIGTTNNAVFLRDQTGNRRFWPITVDREKATKDLWRDMDQYEIDQIWAEAGKAWKNNEVLHLSGELAEAAMRVQTGHTEESEKAGIIREYLDRLLPEDWANKDLAARRNYLHNRDFGEHPEGTMRRDRVCVMEVWAELFEGDPKQLNQLIAREINDILQNTPGWTRYKGGAGKLRFGALYGLQRGYIRKE